MVLYKHKIVVFGGSDKDSYFNDVHVFDLDSCKWQEIKPKLGCLWPSPRSGFQFFVYQDKIYVYGGCSSSDKKVSEKYIINSDLWSLDPRTWEWNEVKNSGIPPGPRGGFSMCVHKKRALLFGGVFIKEMEEGDSMRLLLDEIYVFQLDNHCWYPLELRKDKTTKNKLKNKPDGKVNYIDLENKTGPTERENTLFDEDGLSDNDDDSNMSANLHKKLSKTDTVEGFGSNKNVMVQKCVLQEIVKPCRRMNSCMVVGKDTLYIYGGSMEVNDKDITFDDLYALNLNKLDAWKCIIPASESEWIKVSFNSESVNCQRTRIEQIRASLDLSGSHRTPSPGESLKEFYKRTNTYWQRAAYQHTQHTGREIREDGFDLAKDRYKELKPILGELSILEAEQKAEEARKKGGK